MNKLILLIFLTLTISLQAQLNENFTDGNFTNNPTWSGDTSQFKITSSTAIPTTMRPGMQLYATIAGNSYLVSPNPITLGNNEFDFWIKLSFNPSSNNNARVYIVSDQSNLKGALNGYYIGIGETGDRITFCKQSGLIITTLLTGTIANLNNTTNPLRVQVKRSSNGLWKIYSDTTGGTLFNLEGSFTDNTFNSGAYFGFNCVYTASYADKFYFDDIYAGPLIVDTIAPTVVSVSIINTNKLDVLFSEIIDQNTSENVLNYYVDNAFANPVSAQLDVVNKSLVHLNFTQTFLNGILYTININNIKDVSGNYMNQVAKTFIIAVANDSSIFNVLINEIMTDENPAPNQLPALDYIELYNRSSAPVNLNQWAIKLKDDGDTLYFGNVTIQANRFLILCDNGSVAALTPFCTNIFSFNTFTVNNETCVTLFNPAKDIIHQVNFTSSWYHDAAKNQGGWALEQIDANNPCGGINNWKASKDLSGGTPGRTNSVNTNNPDNIPPQINKICVEDSNSITIYFNETMLKSKLLNTNSYQINPVLNIDHIKINPIEINAVTIRFTDIIQRGQIYNLTIHDTITDCAGNILKFNNVNRFAFADSPEINDIIINEVLFNPKPDGVDFVEIYNNSQKNIALNKLWLSGYDTYFNVLKYAYTITTSCQIIFKGDYMALTTDPTIIKQQYKTLSPDNFISMTSMPAYNNDEGIVVLAKTDSAIIDRFDYNASMHFPLLINVEGVSLERINPNKSTQDKTNWHSASELSGFATPAYQNSQYSDFLYLEDPFTISPEIFSPDNDGRDDVLQINYKFTFAGLIANVLIYDSKGRLVKNLIRNELMGTKGTFIWDGINDANTKAIIGIYIIYIEVFDIKGNVQHYKKTAVLGGRL